MQYSNFTYYILDSKPSPLKVGRKEFLSGDEESTGTHGAMKSDDFIVPDSLWSSASLSTESVVQKYILNFKKIYIGNGNSLTQPDRINESLLNLIEEMQTLSIRMDSYEKVIKTSFLLSENML